MLNKIYKNEAKFSDMNNHFNFKDTIFLDKYRLIRLVPNSYIDDVFIILFSQTQMHYYTNCNNFSSFDQFCTMI